MPNPAVRAASARVPSAATDRVDRHGAIRHAVAPASLVVEYVAVEERPAAAEERVAVVEEREAAVEEREAAVASVVDQRRITYARFVNFENRGKPYAANEAGLR